MSWRLRLHNAYIDAIACAYRIAELQVLLTTCVPRYVGTAQLNWVSMRVKLKILGHR